MFYRLLLSLALIVSATPVASDEMTRHLPLRRALSDAGVRVEINPRDCDASVAGFYQVTERGPRLAVCQDNRGRGSRQVDWTANDLDTLRHESWHLLQDCRDGVVDMMIPDLSGKRIDEIIDQYGAAKALWIWQRYQARDLYTEGIYQEIEAFYAAETLAPEYIGALIKVTCPAK